MGRQTSNKKTPYKFFAALFLFIVGVAVFNGLKKSDNTALLVPDNAGVSVLETAGDALVCVFKGGQVASWDWGNLPQQQADFAIGTDRVVLLDAKRLAAVSVTGRKLLSVYRLPSGEKTKDLSVGWEDQEVWPRISFDKKRIALVRKSPADSNGKVLYEFLTVDLDKELTGIPASLSIQSGKDEFVDYAVDGNETLYAVGSTDKIGRIAAVNLDKGKTLWDKTYDATDEFCSVMVSPDNDTLLAGNRNGILYKLDTKTGEILKEIVLLEEGETRPITNDYSVLNLAFSPDGKDYAATINPRAYLLKADTDVIFHTSTPADKLVSKIAFSPDDQFVATSDIRQSYPVKIWKIPQDN